MKASFFKVVAVSLLLVFGVPHTFGQKSRTRCEAVKDLYIINEDESKVTLQRVIEVPGESAWDIYVLARTSLNSEDLNANYEILSTDVANYTITAKGTYNAFYKRKPTSTGGIACVVENDLKIETKDGKLRATMVLNRYKNDLIDADITSIYPFNDKANRNKKMGGNRYITEPGTVSKSDASKYFNAAVTTGDELLKKIERKLNTKKTDW